MKKFFALIFFVLLAAITSTNCFFVPKMAFAAQGGSSMIVVEQESGLVVASKNENEKRKMASTTKILTAITVIESGIDLNKIIKVPQKAVGVEGSSIYLKRDEEISIEALLYGLMLRSGNDSAVALAIATSGSVEKFVDQMNKKATEIGATNSHFDNPHGLDSETHYTTASDLAKITCYALKNPTFKKIVSTKTYHTQDGENGKLFVNKNKMLRLCDGAIGVKTGFTKKSGRCLVSAVERDGLTFVCVVLNEPDWFNVSKNLLEQAHAKYQKVKFDFSTPFEICIDEADEESENVKGFAAKMHFEKVVLKDDAPSYRADAIVFDNLVAPLKKGDKVGEILITKGGDVIEKIDIVLKDDIDKKKPEFKEFVKDLLR